MTQATPWLSSPEAEALSLRIANDFGITLSAAEILRLGAEESVADRVGQLLDAAASPQQADVLEWRLEADESPLLRDHRVCGQCVFPTDGYLELLAQALGGELLVERLHLAQPIGVDAGRAVRLRLEHDQQGSGWAFRFCVGDTIHASGRASVDHGQLAPTADHWAVLDRADARLSGAEHYAAEDCGFGPFYQSIEEIRFLDERAVARLKVTPAAVEESKSYLTAPALVDAAFVTALCLARIKDDRLGVAGVYLPVLLENVRTTAPVDLREAYALVELVERDSAGSVFRVTLVDDDNRVVFSCDRMHTRLFSPEELGVAAPNGDTVTGIAIVGMSCRFPGADTADEYWANIRLGRDCITDVPVGRWYDHNFADCGPGLDQTNGCAVGGFLESVDRFDPMFFGISPAEAEIMDPQQRLFLIEAWKALEDAGCSEAGLSGQRCGVFAGASTGDYMQLLDESESKTSYAFTGLAAGILASRISYYLNLTGPSLSIDTACSSSLVAVRQAIASIETGDCDIALAGGVALLLTPDLHVKARNTGMLSASGRCRAFDASADGIVLGEGVGVVVLKPVEAALRDNDRIYAVIRGCGSNQDGRTNGITAPSGQAQRRLLEDVYRRAGVEPKSIGMVEAHGTGTMLGDAVELEALRSVFPVADGAQRCCLTSVKSQIGHTTLAAGVAGLIKAALCLYHQALPPTLHFERSAEAGTLEDTPFRVQSEAKHWAADSVRRAAVSSFGFSGTNCHMVLEEAPIDARTAPAARRYEVIALSAKTPTALAQKRSDLLEWVTRRDPKLPLYVAASLLARGRSHFRHRTGVVCESWDELAGWLAGETREHAPGSSYQEMAAALTAYVNGDTEALLDVYPAAQHRVISMPPYPFGDKRYWLAREKTPVGLHPFVVRHRTSDAASYEFVFSGREDFFAQHHVGGQPVLPGVCLLEFARAVGADFLGVPVGRLHGVRWLEPVSDGKGLKLSIDLRREAAGATFDVVRGHTIICSGSVAVAPDGDPPDGVNPEAEIALSSQHMTSEKFYEYAAERGLQLGPVFRGLQEIHYAVTGRWGRIEAEPGPSHLPPGWLDGALQTALAETDGSADGLRVPYSLDCLNIFAPLPRRGWVRAVTAGDEGDRVFNVTTYDDSGSVVLDIRGFRARSLTPRAGSGIGAGLLCAREVWESSEVGSGLTEASSILVFADEPWDSIRTIVSGDSFMRNSALQWRINPDVVEDYQRLVRELDQMAALPSVVVHSTRSKQPAREIFLWTKALLDHAPRAGCRIVHAGDGSPASAAVSGLGRAVALETPRVHIRVAHHASREQLLAEAGTESADAEVRYEGAERFVRRFAEVSSRQLPVPPSEILRRGGVYLVSGGTGGVGSVLARWLEREWDARVAVLSRRGGETSGNIAHLAADVTSVEQLNRVREEIHSLWGSIDGLFHLAGVQHDALVPNVSVDDFDRILAPKACGIAALDQALANEPLRFFVAFSSIAGQFGNRGQAAYATANRYMDAWCEQREQERAAGRRSGVSRSTNWPLWAEGAMRADEDSAKVVENAGFRPMPNEAAWQALCAALVDDAVVTTVLYGDATRLRRLLNPTRTAELGGVVREYAVPQLLAQTTNIAAHILKAEPGELDPDTNLGEFGFQSINITGLAAQLGQRFNVDITPAALFEYPTLNGIARYLSSVVSADFDDPTIAAQEVDRADTARAVAAHDSAARVIAPGPTDDAIAIVGMAGRMPNSATLEEYWEHLRDGRSCVSEIPADRWDWREYAGRAREGTTLTDIRWGAFVHDVDQFDPLFFGISPKEAASMDPQQRIVLECCWEAIEDSGTAPSDLAGSDTGVFIGVSTSDYADLMKQRADGVTTHGSTGTAHSLLANRVSYLLDLHGPSEPVDTACSSALVAIQRGVEAIRSGRCHAALVGGVNVILNPTLFISFAQAGMLSPDGICRPFDADANGYVRGEGAGIFLLKPLGAALRDGNPIHGAIRAAVVNHGGRATSLTAPNPNAQAQLVEEAIRAAGVAASQISYVEAHGTGTPLGDPIEVNGLRKALGRHDADQRCWIGSVKGNIGHLEAAAGCASLIKVLLALRHCELPPSINIARLNPQLQLDGSRFAIVTERREWSVPTDSPHGVPKRIAGVSSFGFGGANAHLVVEEFVSEREDSGNSEGPQWIIVSARDEEHLRRTAARLATALSKSDASLAEIAWTLQSGRDAARERLAFLADDTEQAVRMLASYGAAGADKPEILRGTAATGQTPSSVDFTTAGECWVRGERVDWRALHPVPPAKVAIPGSAFVRQHCWFTESANPMPNSGRRNDSFSESSPLPVVLEPTWERAPLAESVSWTGRLTVVGASVEERQAFEQLALQVQFLLATDLADAAGAAGVEADAIVMLRPDVEAWRVIATAAARNVGHAIRWLLVTNDSQLDPSFEMLDGIGRALVETSSRYCYGSLRAPGLTAGALAKVCVRELVAMRVGTVCEARIETGERFVRGYRERVDSQQPYRYRDGSVYLVTGGLGSLGSAVARRMIGRGAAVALLGRAEPNAQKAALLADLQAHGRVMYCQADVADSRQLDAALRTVRGRWGPIRGLVHAAGTMGESKLANKSASEWDSVLRSKVDAALALDAATAGDQLDFFVLFSSLAAAVGDLGRGDYAAANRFLDAFAAQRTQRGPGRTLSVGWGLWRDTGLTDADQVDTWQRATGLRALESESALDVLERLLASEAPHVLVTAGDVSGIIRAKPAPTVASVAAPAPDRPAALPAALNHRISELVHRILQVPQGTVGEDAALQDYGLDSILLNQLAQKLEEMIGPIPKSILLERGSIRGIVAHFAATTAIDYADSDYADPRMVASRNPDSASPPAVEPIAITGLAGRYPGATTLAEFWKNLHDGHSAISDLPSPRWAGTEDDDLQCRRGGFLVASHRWCKWSRA
ncbi:SDR family NAD(P)-dependent oxidoreductase [Mycobacterium sp.]|uniref:SDR family NAD(P)-dependent oxidoreductase n=1 Tax=Mycobacterium sp. TaxID=1785 RepID=UPI003BAD41AF